MVSLKAFIPPLAEAVGMTSAALYERQRALVRAGLLQSEPGRGPGSGVRATPESVSLLLIALISAGGLSEVETQAKLLHGLKSDKRCILTGKKTFGESVAAALSSEEIANQMKWIEAETGKGGASCGIGFKRGSKRWAPVLSSQFGSTDEARASALRLKSTLALKFGVIARALASEAKEMKYDRAG